MSVSNRRRFLKTTAAGLTAGGLVAQAAAQPSTPNEAGAATRKLGRHDERVPVFCLGGFHLGDIDENLAIRMMHEAIDNGLTFFDNAWDYHQGGSERVMGKGLSQGGYREKAFLMTKNCARDYEGSKKHLEDSLTRLQTDHLDLWQFHEINYPQDPDWIFERGAIRAAIEARQEGKVRYIGFTGHKSPDYHLTMLNKPRTVEGYDDFEWDTVQMPINLLDAQFNSFQKQVAPVRNERGVAALGMKSLGGGALVQQLGLSATECWRFSLARPITSLVIGLTTLEQLREAIAVARDLKPLPEDRVAALLRQTKEQADSGQYERFKTTRQFDGQYHRQQHGV